MRKSKKPVAKAAASQATNATSVVPVVHEVVSSSPKPWDRPVDGKVLLADIVKRILAYTSMTPEAALAVALWVVYSYAYEKFMFAPILAIVSPMERCGKSTLLTVVGYLGQRVLATSRMTVAAVYRAVATYAPTLLIDEADTFLTKHEGLRGILDSGHARGSANATVSSGNGVANFPTWCPKVIALIGSLPRTIEDRSVVIMLRRKAPHDKVKKLNVDSQFEFAPLARKIARWAQDNAIHLPTLEPTIPEGLHNRAEDNWMPLLAIAERIGGKWPHQAREAALQLSGEGAAQNVSIGEMLVRDIKRIFTDGALEKIESPSLASALAEMEDRPWAEIRRGGKINKHKLANLLKPFGIRPKPIRDGQRVYRGYTAEDFRDAFARYAA